MYEGDDYFDDDDMKAMRQSDLDHESEFQMKVAEIKEKLQRIRANVATVDHHQGTHNVVYARDYNNVVNTLRKVDFWGAAHLVAVMVIALMQVYIMKGLFDDKYTLKKLIMRQNN